MQRTYRRLIATQVAKLAQQRRPGMYPDGDGLYAGVPSWSFRFMIGGKAREMGLGPLRDVNLTQARQLAYEARQQKRQCLDPLETRRARQQGAVLHKAKTMTFAQAPRRTLPPIRQAGKNAKHARERVQSLATYVDPVFGAVPVDMIDTGLIALVVEPLWGDKPDTGSRVRGRVEAILDWAKARYCDGENPARWKGHLDNLLPPRRKVRAVVHHPALPYREISAVISELRRYDDTGIRALELLILTATRSGEVLQARWDEFDLAQKLWIVPAARMKSAREHRVPLSDRAIAILDKQLAVRTNDYVFAGSYGAAHVGSNLLLQTLRRLGHAEVTPHGFRSTFADWGAEQTTFPSEVREMALAHKVSNAVEVAYRRGDLFDKRRQLADAWTRYCATDGAVVSFPERAAIGGTDP
jgi:integrase